MIQLERLHKSFGLNKVLQGVSLKIAKGSSLVVIGGSGTGKSVILKCILGLMRVDQGHVFLEGKDMQTLDRDHFLSRFGMLFQGAALFDSLPVWQNIAFRLTQGALKK